MRLRMNRWSRRHSVLATIAAAAVFCFIFLPQWAASAWALFSNEPLAVWVARQHFRNFPFSPLWITGPIGTVLLIMILLSIRSDKRKAEPVTISTTDRQAAVAIDELKPLLIEGERFVS